MSRCWRSVLTVTMVVVQLAMGQFSPRIVQTFLQDKPSQIAIGLFVATFAHAMLAMREVNFEAKTVPGRGDPRRVRARGPQHRRAGGLRRSHRQVAPSVVAHRAGRRGDATTLDERYPDRGGRRSTRRSRDLRAALRRDLARRRARAGASRRGTRTWCSSCPPGSARSFRPAAHCSRSEGTPNPRSTNGSARARSCSASTAASTRTSPTACGCSSTSPSDPWPTPRSSIRRPPCRRSTGSTTACASSRPAHSPSGQLVDDDGRDASGRPGDDVGRLRALRLPGDPPRRRRFTAGRPTASGRHQRPPHRVPPDRRPVLQHELELLDVSVRDRYGDPSDVSLALTADRQGIGISVTSSGHNGRS